LVAGFRVRLRFASAPRNDEGIATLAVAATNSCAIHNIPSDRLASALPLLLRITLQRGSGGVPNKKRIPNKGAGGDAGLPMAIITCAIIDLVAIALFFGLCVFLCP
jgi:hypothetical protein